MLSPVLCSEVTLAIRSVALSKKSTKNLSGTSTETDMWYKYTVKYFVGGGCHNGISNNVNKANNKTIKQKQGHGQNVFTNNCAYCFI